MQGVIEECEEIAFQKIIPEMPSKMEIWLADCWSA